MFNQQITVASESGRTKEEAIKLANVLNSEIERGNTLLAKTWKLECWFTSLIGLGFGIISIVQMRILVRCRKTLLEDKSTPSVQ